MGLDISSFADLSPAPDAELDEDGFPLDQDKFMYLDPELIKWTEENFPGRTAGIEPGIYSRSFEQGPTVATTTGEITLQEWLSV